MKKTLFKKYNLYLLALTFSFMQFGCEGLEDWSDLQDIDIFTNKDGEIDQSTFKRYSEPGLSTDAVVECVFDPNNMYSKLYQKEIKKACDYTKIPFHSMTVNTWNSSLRTAPTTRVIVLYDTKKLNDASIPKLLDFVSNGGTLFIPFANEDKRMAYLLGFKAEAEYGTNTKVKGWFFSTPVLPNLKGKTYESNYPLFGFAAENFTNKIKILATAVNDSKFPSIVENTVGKGKVLLYNTSGDFSKQDRGFLFAGVLKGLEGIPYPIANTATIFLDDFPAPQYDIVAEPIKSEMNLTTSKFVEKVWWPDMRKLAKEFKVPYSAMLTFDYRNKIVPPFTLDQWNSNKIKINDKLVSLPDWLVDDVAKNGHELAFHGYNHVSLSKKEWKNPKFIETSMSTVKKKWAISDYGKLPTTYVPPSNDIDQLGLKELKKTMPSTKYMCSLFLGQHYEGGDREFDYDSWEKNIFDYPRISSGFYFDDDNKFNIQSLYLYTGIWTHFVHPDDVYQIPATADKRAGGYGLRNPLNYGWRKTKGYDKAMFPEFRSYIKQFINTFPQMRFVNGNDGAKIVIDWRASRYNHNSENGLYTVREINPDDATKQYWFLYGSAVNTEKIEVQLKNQKVLFAKTPFMDGFLYSIYTNKPSLTSVDLNYKSPAEREKQIEVNQLVKADFVKYTIAVKNFLSGGNWKDDSEEKLKLQMNVLKNKMLSNATIDSVQWNKYAKYLSWNDRVGEVWKLYEDHVAKYSSKNNINYSKELDRVVGYLSDEMKEKWMSEQIKVNPNDLELLKSYIVNFDTEEYKDKIKNALKAVYTIENTPENYKNYIKHLLNYYPNEALVELKDKKPDKDFSDLATQIVWLFADNAEYKKALEWTEFSNEIDFVSKMSWYIESGQSRLIEKEYLKYIVNHPDDYKAKALMSSIYHEKGRFKDAWVLANSLPEIPEKEELRKTLNKDVVYEEDPVQQDLIANQSELFYSDVLKKLIKESRLTKGNYVDLNSSVETNQKDPTIFKNLLTYNFFDKKGNLQGISASYNKYYELESTTKDYADNTDNSTIGVQYKFTSAIKEGKPQYWSRARIELDTRASAYYQFGAGINFSKDRTYKSAEFNLYPVETAGGLNQKMYQMQLNVYQEFYLLKKINTILSFEGNYYTQGLLSRDTIIPIINPNRAARKVYTSLESGDTQVETYDDAADGALTLKMILDNGKIKKSKFLPFIESQVSIGSRELTGGYPYWMIKSRFFGGAGLGWVFSSTNFNSKIEGGYFLDDFSGHFERLTATASYQIFDFTALTLNVEVFEQTKYYSNAIQVGIKYNLKRRVRK